MFYEEVYLYGYNEISKKKYHLFKSENIKCSIIDVKAYNIHDRIRIITPEEFFCNVENRSVLIIIMLRDALKHKSIYEMFAKRGYSNILYLPRLETINIDNAKTMLLYGDFLEDNACDVILTPNKIEYSMRNSLKKNIFYRSSTRVILLMQTDYIYSHSKIDEFVLTEFEDIPLKKFEPYFELWKYFDGKSQSFEMYENKIGIFQKLTYSVMSSGEMMNNRKCLFESFQHHYNCGDEFFELSASIAKWNDKGYFNLEDGKHRASYLIYKNEELIPISVSIGDYKKYNEYLEKHSYINFIESLENC